MHTIHHTEAFVLKKLPSGEANVRVWLFTKDFGLVVAVVQGVRKAGAKLHMHLSEYAHVQVDLVRGREVWRLISSSEIQTLFVDKTAYPLGRFFVRTLQAVLRFCHGEEYNAELFEHIKECHAIALSHKGDEQSLDTLSLWRVLVLLGYIPVEEEDSALLEGDIEQCASSLEVSTRRRLIKETNDAIKATHL